MSKDSPRHLSFKDLGLKFGSATLALSLLIGNAGCALTGETKLTPTPVSRPTLGPVLPPTPTPEAKVTPIIPEGLTASERQIIVRGMLDTKNYPINKVDELITLAKNGNGQSTLYEGPNGERLFVVFPAITEDNAAYALSGTEVKTTTTSEPGGDVFQVRFGISIGSHIRDFPPAVREDLIRRESVVALATINGLTEFFRSQGVDPTKPLDPQFLKLGIQGARMRSKVDDLGGILIPYSDLIARVQDAIGLLPLIDSNPNQSGALLFRAAITPNGINVPVPVISGQTYDDSGKTYEVVSTLGGKTIAQFSNIGQVQNRYPSFDQIPNWSAFVNQVRGN